MKNQEMDVVAVSISSIICDWLVDIDVTHIFMVPGGQIDFLAEQVVLHPLLEVVVACDELGAGALCFRH